MINVFAQKLWQFILLAIILLLGTGCGTPTPDGIIISAGPEIGRVSINGVMIAYERYGPEDGETVLLIAGTGNQLIDWPIELVEELVK